jgi:hypothetical protein
MATNPSATNPASGFQPAFKRVAQSNDCDCAFACIAMVANKTLPEVRQVAVDKFKLPPHGLFWITQDMINGLFAHFGWVSTIYKEATKIAELPDITVLMVDYDPTTEIGRHVLFHRQRAAGGVEYIIDPAYWVEPTKQIRMDVKGLPPPLWYIGVHAMKTANK